MRLIRLLPWLALALAGCAHDPDRSLLTWLKGGNGDRFEPLGDASAAGLGKAFSASLVTDARVAPAWADLGFEPRFFAGQHAVRELAPARRGWGAYAFRSDPARALVIQAPHSDTDLGTGRIAIALYRVLSAWSVALNSTPRTTTPDADLARDGGPFVELADAALTLDANVIVLQVHGFGPRTAKTYGLSGSSVVVSNGSRAPDPALREFAARLAAAGFDARLFPEQSRYPGGTNNPVGRRFRERATGRFVHLELGAELRRQLLDQPARLEAFAACL